MTLIRYTYFPGWTQGDYTEWESTIDTSGLVRQHMNPEVGKTKRKHGVDIRERQLDERELEALIGVLSEIDPRVCNYFRDLGICIEDVEVIGLRSERFEVDYTGALLTIQHMAKRKMKEVEPDALRSMVGLWRHVDKIQPYSLQAQQKKR